MNILDAFHALDSGDALHSRNRTGDGRARGLRARRGVWTGAAGFPAAAARKSAYAEHKQASMTQRLGLVTVVVSDYDAAIAYYTRQLGFELVEDSRLSDTKRWVVVRPGAGGAGLLLARAANDQQHTVIGCQAGGRVFLFLYTDDFERDFALYSQRGVQFLKPPRQETYGTVAVFADLYGNRWDLIGPAAGTPTSGAVGQ